MFCLVGCNTANISLNKCKTVGKRCEEFNSHAVLFTTFPPKHISAKLKPPKEAIIFKKPFCIIFMKIGIYNKNS